MSSATSIRRSLGLRTEAGSSAAHPDGTGPEEAGRDLTPTRQGFRPWHFFVLASLAASTAAVMLSRQSAPEHLILISLTIGAAGAAAAAFHRMIAPFTVRDVSVLSARPSERARAVLEREKALVLRSIKELEFDRAMGKLSERDFDEMAGRLRARAIALIKQLDAGGSGYRELIERELRTRINTGAAGAPAAGAAVTDGELRARRPDPTEFDDPASTDSAAHRACAACSTINDADAAFCKRCGTSLATRH